MTNSKQEVKTVLVLGSTGKTGRRIAQRLSQLGLTVRGGSRTGQPRFDWEDAATWTPALTGMDAVYISYYPDLAFPGASETIRLLAGRAVECGVRRLVLLSGRGEEGALRGEEAVRQAGVDWTIVRSSFFNQNFTESFLLEALLSGEVAFPAGPVGEPFIDAEDVAEVATAALTDSRHSGQIYEVTGPRLLSFSDAVTEIAQATGREIRYLQVSAEDYAAGMLAQGVPETFVTPLVELFTTILDGRNEQVCDGVQRALGRAPRDFSEFTRDAAAARAWNGMGSSTHA